MKVTGRQPKFEPEKIKKILVIRLMSLGDVILSTPALSALKSHFRNAEISMLVDDAFSDAILEHQALTQVFALPRRQMRKLPFMARMREEVKWFQKIRGEKFDLVVDLQNTPRSMWYTLFSGVPLRVGLGHRKRGFAYNYRVYPENRYAVEVNLDPVRALGAPVTDKRLRVVLRPEAEQKVEKFLKAQGIEKGDKLVAFHVGGGWPAKFWPASYFQQLAWLIQQENTSKIVLLQGPKEEQVVPQIAAGMRQRPLVAKDFSIQETGALLKRCSILVTDDTGPMHLGLALQVPTIGLFGQEYKDLWFPPQGTVKDYAGYEKAVALQHLVWCSPCHLDECGRLECLKGISPAEVWQEMKRLVG